jgi:hypothetical protein
MDKNLYNQYKAHGLSDDEIKEIEERSKLVNE